MATLGLCMIAKDEEQVLGRCLESARPFADEIVVADTGSHDRTKEIAASYGAAVYDFPWQDDFAAARNFSFAQAHTDYILWLDCDDVIEPQFFAAFDALKRGLDGSADAYMLPYRAGADEQGNAALVFYRERIVRRACGFVWEGAVHEAIAVRGNVRWGEAAVTHKKPAGRTAPGRNLRIYARQFARGIRPTPRDVFYFARELSDCGLPSAAADVFAFFLRGEGWVENKISACRDLAACHRRLGEPERELAALFRSFDYAPPRPEICCDVGSFFMRRQDWKQAIFWFKLAVNEKADPCTGAFTCPDCSGYIPYLWMCVCYDRLGEYERAAHCNELAGRCRPGDESVAFNRRYFAQIFQDKGQNQ